MPQKEKAYDSRQATSRPARGARSSGLCLAHSRLTEPFHPVYDDLMIVTSEIGAKPLSDLIKQVQAGDEVLLTQGNKPVAKIVSATEKETSPSGPLRLRSFKGHRVLTPVISRSEIADEMFGQ